MVGVKVWPVVGGGGKIMDRRGWWRQTYAWSWVVVRGCGWWQQNYGWSWVVARFSNAHKNSPFINTKLFIKTLLYKNMPSERFGVCQKSSFIKKNMEQSKYKESKKYYHRISQLRNLSSISIVYDSTAMLLWR